MTTLKEKNQYCPLVETGRLNRTQTCSLDFREEWGSSCFFLTSRIFFTRYPGETETGTFSSCRKGGMLCFERRSRNVWRRTVLFLAVQFWSRFLWTRKIRIQKRCLQMFKVTSEAPTRSFSGALGGATSTRNCSSSSSSSSDILLSMMTGALGLALGSLQNKCIWLITFQFDKH